MRRLGGAGTAQRDAYAAPSSARRPHVLPCLVILEGQRQLGLVQYGLRRVFAKPVARAPVAAEMSASTFAASNRGQPARSGATFLFLAVLVLDLGLFKDGRWPLRTISSRVVLKDRASKRSFWRYSDAPFFRSSSRVDRREDRGARGVPSRRDCPSRQDRR